MTSATEAPIATTPPRRTQEQRRERTRAALLDATVETLLEVGYSRTTTTEICIRAGVSQGALFKHFPTKQALLAASVEHLYTRLLNTYEVRVTAPDIGSVNIPDAIEALWRTFEQPELMVAYELQVASRTDPDLRQLLTGVNDSHATAMRSTALVLFPDAASSDRFAPLLDTVLETLQGLAISRMILPDPDHEGRVLGVLKDLARATLEEDEPGREESN